MVRSSSRHPIHLGVHDAEVAHQLLDRMLAMTVGSSVWPSRSNDIGMFEAAQRFPDEIMLAVVSWPACIMITR